MWCQGTTLINTADGKRYVRASIYGDSVPVTMPTNGTGIDGLNADDVLTAGSIFYCVGNGNIFMLNSAGSWVEQ